MLMFITKNLHRVFAAIILFVLVTATMLLNGVTHAQSTGLGVVPRKDMNIAAGKTVQDKLYITNLNKKAVLKVSISVLDFKSANETGTPSLQLSQKSGTAPWSLKPFISIPSSITLQPGETQNIPYTITIPAKQSAGSYYSAIRYSAEGGGEQNVTVSASAATLAFLTVPGKATEQMSLKQFGAYNIADTAQDGEFKSLFVTSQPAKLAYIVENRGNVAENPAGSIEITNIFGKQVRLIKDANPKGSLALIGQTRRFEVCFANQTKKVNDNGSVIEVESCKNPGLLPGMYKAHMNVFYGINGSDTHEIDTTAVFWYLPYWSILVVLGILAVITYLVYALRTRYVSYKSQRQS